jgi:hypothetical protein
VSQPEVSCSNAGIAAVHYHLEAAVHYHLEAAVQYLTVPIVASQVERVSLEICSKYEEVVYTSLQSPPSAV